MKEEFNWEIGKQLNIPRNLDKTVMKDMISFYNRITSSSEFKSMTKKQKIEMVKLLPEIVTVGYCMEIFKGAMDGMGRKHVKKVMRKRK